MELTRVTTALCLFLVALCVAFSICAMDCLRRTAKDVVVLHEEAQATLNELKEQNTEEVETKNDFQTDSDVPVDILYESFYMRECGGKIAIYTATGELVRLLDIAVETLPSADQILLQNGIELHSWKEVLALIADFGG